MQFVIVLSIVILSCTFVALIFNKVSVSAVSVLLSIPDIGKPYQVHTDASGFAVAAAIGQLDGLGKEWPVAFASQKLAGSQLGWSTIEKEAYAII